MFVRKSKYEELLANYYKIIHRYDLLLHRYDLLLEALLLQLKDDLRDQRLPMEKTERRIEAIQLYVDWHEEFLLSSSVETVREVLHQGVLSWAVSIRREHGFDGLSRNRL